MRKLMVVGNTPECTFGMCNPVRMNINNSSPIIIRLFVIGKSIFYGKPRLVGTVNIQQREGDERLSNQSTADVPLLLYKMRRRRNWKARTCDVYEPTCHACKAGCISWMRFGDAPARKYLQIRKHICNWLQKLPIKRHFTGNHIVPTLQWT